ncbi:glycosyltransferase family 2 protein [Stackebrandtia nassauensis]|uniref:Glycosyl transferase family 2 n=1 Tax=Stackebrandtia nassauensis (strain DSM 44728 / CIP 108903 / NRRL B-16338 / NBRC 102104 / LLR-40K-21) TaxID=446470 RepID=D3QAC0_STANL|nr:glycosyltransferase [Stackebrandtia nassauensis]ADD42703.1 glycosyl transferase family 2 [Stackebrandtia nassauensis DSM 44728]
MTDNLLREHPVSTTTVETQTGRFLPLPEWTKTLERLRNTRARPGPCVAVIRMVPSLRGGHQTFGAPPPGVASIVETQLDQFELLTVAGDDLLVLLRGDKPKRIQARLGALMSLLAESYDAWPPEVVPACGWVPVSTSRRAPHAGELIRRASLATDLAAHKLDLVPVRWSSEHLEGGAESKKPGRFRTTVQIVTTLLLGIGLPLGVYMGLDTVGIDILTPAYLVIVAVLVVNSALMWAENLHALDPKRPGEPKEPFPPASAIIAAYLPNEAETIIDTVRALLAQNYPGRLQVILAYNTPRPLPVEAQLRLLARRDPRLVVLEVPFSTSKAQNVNAALGVATGEFVGVFDADHQPAPLAFHRAWRWIADGADVVQGHCVVRNGHDAWVPRTVAVEFEAIYAVSHPGRAALHGFGIFGGSNGFWRTSLLRRIRMRPDMLTEDIDSSMRALLQGSRIVSDPALLSFELAPESLGPLWHQRMRWAQGWFQVSRRHLLATLRSASFNTRNKLGSLFLLGWRELTPWASLQIVPVVAALAWQAGGVTKLDWMIPAFLLTSLYALSVGPVQTLFAWRLAVPEIKKKPWWFGVYLLFNAIFYTEWKNVICRVAQLKELSGERRWVVTPRHKHPGAA